MTIFEEPKIEVIRLNPDDIITSSGCGGPGCTNDTEESEPIGV